MQSQPRSAQPGPPAAHRQLAQRPAPTTSSASSPSWRASTKTCAPPTNGCWSAALNASRSAQRRPRDGRPLRSTAHFADALDDLKRHVALAQDSGDGIEITPMLLLGPPGIGKTHLRGSSPSCWAPA